MEKNKRKYGWRPDLPDQRDICFVPKFKEIPKKIDWSEFMPPVYDQGNLGSCTANGIAGAFDWERKQSGKEFIYPSRLFVYYNERAMEGTIGEDAGAFIRDGIKSVNKLGTCKEENWKYEVDKFACEPPKVCYEEALGYQVLEYKRVNSDIISLKQALAENPVVFGFTVYESFETEEVSKTGVVPMPKENESALGGHCVVAVGYDDETRKIKCRNSWGESWGDCGYFYLPYEYFTSDLTDDYWVIKLVE